jgi:glucan biosynthesis protein C
MSVPALYQPVGRQGQAPPGRLPELDLLRALVAVGLVFFHTAVIFGAGEFPVKAPVQSRAVTVGLAFGATWGMPLLFLVSGMGAWYSLRSRSAGTFARERLRRLGVPLLTGLLILVPLQVYLGERRSGDPGSYGGFLARFADVRPSLDFPFLVEADPGGGAFETGHLWFLVCLLAYSLVLLPGLAWLGRPAGAPLRHWLGGRCSHPAGVLLPALPVAAVELALGSEVGHGGWHHASYALFLLAGFLVAAEPELLEAFRRHWRPAAVVGLLAFLAAGATHLLADPGTDPLTAMDPASLGLRLLKSLAGWLWVVAIIGAARARTDRPHGAHGPPGPRPGRPGLPRRLGRYANEAVLPFYVLHETVIVVVAYVVLAWPVGAAAQYAVIALTSLAATLLLYDLAVRRTPVTRFLFGLRPTEPLAARPAGRSLDWPA